MANKYNALMDGLEKEKRLPKGLLNALIQTESNWNNDAVSPVGAKGLAQFMPATAKQYGVDVNDPESSIRGSAQFLGDLSKKYKGDLPKTLAGYNWGQGNLDRKGIENAPTETKNYMDKILSLVNPISSAEASETPYKPTRAEFMAMKIAQGYKPKSVPTRAEFMAMKIAQGYKPASTNNIPEQSANAERDNEPSQPEQPSILARAAKNLPKDITSIGESAINMVKHPIDTLSTVGGLPMGALGNALPESLRANIPAQDIENARNVGKSIVGAIKHPLETFAEKPASTLLNTIGIFSGVHGLTKATVGKAVSKSAALDAGNAATKNALMAPKRAVLEAGQKAGFVVPKSEVASNFINNRLEGFAGKAALNQESILRNQAATSAQARKALGLSDDTAITGKVIADSLESQYAPYKAVAELPTPPSPGTHRVLGQLKQIIPASSSKLLEELKQSRSDATAWRKSAAAQGGNPDMIAKARAASKRAKEIETEFETRAVDAGKPELVPQLRKARENIAKIHGVDNARNVATGEIDPRIIGAVHDKAPNKLTGELKQIGEFQQAFPKYAKAGENVQTPGVSKLEAVTALGGGAIGGGFGGTMGAFIGAMVPLASTPVRNMLLSKGYQNSLLKAMTKNPSKVKSAMNAAINKPVSRNSLLGIAASDKD